MHTVKMTVDEYAAYQKMIASQPDPVESNEMSEGELEDKLADILKPTILHLSQTTKLNGGLPKTIRAAARAITVKQRKSETKTAYIKRMIAGAEKAAKILAVRPLSGLLRGKGKDASTMATMGNKMLKSYGLNMEGAIGWHGDLDMVAMNLHDAADHHELGCHLYRGNLKKAKNASNMDTSSRDMIPNTVWGYLWDD